MASVIHRHGAGRDIPAAAWRVESRPAPDPFSRHAVLSSDSLLRPPAPPALSASTPDGHRTNLEVSNCSAMPTPQYNSAWPRWTTQNNIADLAAQPDGPGCAVGGCAVAWGATATWDGTDVSRHKPEVCRSLLLYHIFRSGPPRLRPPRPHRSSSTSLDPPHPPCPFN